MLLTLSPDTIYLGESSTLHVQRKKFYFPKLRVFIGEFDENYNLPDDEPVQYFEDTDSAASVIIIPETAGNKKIRGIIEEYLIIKDDSIDSFQYPFEIKLLVIDTIRSSNI